MRISSLFNYYLTGALLSSCLGLWSCSSPGNNSAAEVKILNGKPFVLLTGRRLLMTHDPISAMRRETYEDSVLLPLPETAKGILPGRLIPHEAGNYSYEGEISVTDNTLLVNLFYNNTDDHRQDPLIWNGEYELVRP